MANLLEIFYDRVVSTEEIILTKENASDYGYDYEDIEDETLGTITIYFLEGTTSDDYIAYDETGITTIEYNTYQRYTHVAPACSSYTYSFDDVDKDGSGRNDLTGEMYRERLGSYTNIEMTWDLIPNSVEYNNWFKILTNLPSNFYANILTPAGEIETKQFYRLTISTNLYLFMADKQIWQGLSTSMTQWNIDEYDETLEPTLESVE